MDNDAHGAPFSRTQGLRELAVYRAPKLVVEPGIWFAACESVEGGQMICHRYVASSEALEQRTLVSTTPSILWQVNAGSSYGETVDAVAQDSQSDLIVVGRALGPDLALWSAETPNPAYIEKLRRSGESVWYVKKPGWTLRDVAVDAEGDIWVVGSTTRVQDGLPAALNSPPGNFASFVFKMSGTGQPLWSRYIASDHDAATIALDAAGNAFIGGTTSSPEAEGASNALNGRADGLVAKVSKSGELVWTRYIGGSGVEELTDIALSPDGTIVLTGTTDSTDLLSNRWQLAGLSDVYVAKLEMSGEVRWLTYAGGEEDDGVGGVAVDQDGSIVLVGGTQPMKYSHVIYDSSAYMVRLDASGTVIWDRTFDGNGSDYFLGVAISPNRSIYVVARSTSDDLAQTQLSAEGPFILEFDINGQMLRTTPIGIAEFRPSGILIGADSETLVAGYRFHDATIWGDDHIRFRHIVAGIVASVDLGGSPATSVPGEPLIGSARNDTIQISSTTADYASVVTITINGTVGEPFIPTGPLTIYGLAGNDTISIDPDVAFPVVVYGGDGNDTVTSGNGNSSLYGGTGDDRLVGGGGNDLIEGGEGADTLAGGDGADTLYGHDGSDSILGSDGDDELYGNDGDDTLAGGTGNDYLAGNDDHDSLGGDGGNDTLYGNFGSDTLSGGSGDDQIFGGIGRDVISGSIGDDTLLGGNGVDLIYGGPGHDHIEGKGKADTLHGGIGNDTINSGAGADLILGEDGDDTLYANPHVLFHDTLAGGPGHDRYQADEDDILMDLEEPLLA